MRADGSQTALVLKRQFHAAKADPGPSFMLPMMPSLLMLIVFTAVFDSLGSLSGFSTGDFETSSWDAYLVPGAVMLVALLGGGYTSSSLAFDLRSGYFERMRMVGVKPGALLSGRLIFESLRVLPGAAVVLVVGLLLGGEVHNGAAGIAILLVLVGLLSAAFGGVFFLVAIATEDPQTPFTMQPLGLPLAFLSSALVPLAIMPAWSEALASANPVTVVVDAGRHAMIGDLWSTGLLAAFAVLAAGVAITEFAALRLLHLKVARG